MDKPKLFWVHNTRWETEEQLIKRLKGLSKTLTLAQMATSAGLSHADRDPAKFAALLKKHRIVYAPATKQVKWGTWQRPAEVTADAQRKLEIAAARAEMIAKETPLYRRWSF